MGVDGCWCAPRSSKPVRGVKSLSGEFDPHMLPPEPRGRVPRGFLKNVDFPLDRTEGSSYNTTVRGVSRTISYPGVAQLVARMVRDHEAASSSLATPTIKKPEISMVSGFFLFLETALTTPDTPKTPPTLSILLKNAGQVLHRTAARIAAFRACAAFLLLACPNWTRLFCCGFTLRAGQRRCCLRCLRGLRRADSRSPTRRT